MPTATQTYAPQTAALDLAARRTTALAQPNINAGLTRIDLTDNYSDLQISANGATEGIATTNLATIVSTVAGLVAKPGSRLVTAP